MEKPDNIVYNIKDDKFDSFRRSYPTSFSSKKFEPEKLKDLSYDSRNYFRNKFLEIKKEYETLLEKLNWNEIIYNAKYNFNPIVGKSYYLYQNKEDNTFLSIIEPDEWDMQNLGTFRLLTNNTWEKIK
tara:strand:+ start:19986 stop:20369 length:384 start_codon:yes stop_codon:yes gene_type:complete